MNNADMPAMPIGEQIDGVNMNPICNGLTKREHFAAVAMQGLLGDHTIDGSLESIANTSVRFADALLKELEK